MESRGSRLMRYRNVYLFLCVCIGMVLGKGPDDHKFCPAGFDKVGHECVKTTSTPAKAHCPAGTRTETDHHTGEVTCVSVQTATPERFCDADFTMSHFHCVKEIAEPAEAYCPHGYEMSGDGCTKVMERPYDEFCPAGYQMKGDSMCVKKVTHPMEPMCSSGYTLSGSKCLQTMTTGYLTSCPAGYMESGGGMCTMTQTVMAAKICPEGGSLDGDSCVKTRSAPVERTCPGKEGGGGHFGMLGGGCYAEEFAPKEMTCPHGMTYDETMRLCKKCDAHAGFVSKGGECDYSDPTFVCPHGYSKSYSSTGSKEEHQCMRKVPLEWMENCPAGFEEVQSSSGHKSKGGRLSCIARDVYASVLNCPGGSATSYVLSGNDCVRTLEAPVRQYCPEGYKDDMNGCSKTLMEQPEWICTAGTMGGHKGCYTMESAPIMTRCSHGYDDCGGTCCKTSHTHMKHKCPHGFSLDRSDHMCHSRITESPKIACPKGYDLEGHKCVFRQAEAAAMSCGMGFDLSGDGCVQVTRIPAYDHKDHSSGRSKGSKKGGLF